MLPPRTLRFAGATGLILLGLTVPTSDSQQAVQHGPAADDVWSWHSAERLRSVVREKRATADEVIEAAQAELALARPDHALGLLREMTADSAPQRDPRILALMADAAGQAGEVREAGELYARAGAVAVGVERGTLSARAGAAFERAGDIEAAKEQYRRARLALPGIGGWIAIREAAVTQSTAEALQLIRRAPPEAKRLANRAKATVLLSAGDSVAALRSWVAASDDTAAAKLALSLGDTAAARGHAYMALRANDSARVRAVLPLLRGPLRPTTSAERLQAAAAVRGIGEMRDGLAWVETVVAAGDSSAPTMLLFGRLLSDAGRRAEALGAYASAMKGADPEAGSAAYRRARLLLRVGRRSDGYAALLAFAEAHPDWPEAADAFAEVAAARRRAGRVREADSLVGVLTERWPRDPAVGQVRLERAAAALVRGDSGDAVQWLRAEVNAEGAQRHAAQLLLGHFAAARGRHSEAHSRWYAVVQDDSLGYYGAVARALVGGELPRIAAPTPSEGSIRIRAAFQRLDVLRDAFPDGPEVQEFVEWLTSQRDGPVSEVLDIGEGLVARGWMREGVRLGWHVVRRHTLHDPRVLRLVYPWPYRNLIESEARKFDIDPYLLAAMIRQESAFLPTVTSRAGARGLMQLMPATAAYVAKRLRVEWRDPFLGVPDANVHIGSAHLGALLRRYDGAVLHALAAYNAGGTPVNRWLRRPDAQALDLFVERIPYMETRNYVKSVRRNVDLYRALYPPRDPGSS